MNRNSDIYIIRYRFLAISCWLLAFSLMPFSFVNAQIVIGGSVYGGGNAGDTGGSTTVTVRAGDIDEVFGGARMADVNGSAFVHFDGEHASNYIVINKAYGGNDIAGKIGSKAESKVLPNELTQKSENEINNTWDAFVRISTKTTTDADGNVVEVDNAPKIYIGQLFAGGNGDYTYTTEADANGDYLAKDGDAVVATSKSLITKPELNKTYLEVLGGSIVYAYGGGNNATIKDSTVICVDNPSKVVNSIIDTKNPNANKDPEKGTVGELLTADRFQKQMGINTALSYPGSDEFQIGRFFGGNNKAEMAIRPVWNLKSGKIRNLYSGGNQGAMTNPEGLFLEIAENSKIIIDNVYGGCRMADVHPLQSGTLQSGVYVESKSDEIDLNIPGYNFPKGLSARLVILGGDINNVYGGNDVTGKVYGGNAVGIHTTIRGDIYGGGNGSYPYTDNPKLKDDDIYGDMYYDPDKVLAAAGLTATSPALKSVEALNAFRPNAEQVSVRLIGKEGTPTVIHGSVYCGGNSATIASTKDKPMVELKIGSYVIADNVFLGNNGANMVTTNKEVKNDQGLMTKREGTLRTLVRTDIASDGTKFSSMDLTDHDTFAKYMEGAAMSLMPSVVFDEQPRDPDTYKAYSSSIGSFFCGGNVGSMTSAGKTSIEFDDKIIIYDKVVGGCNNANVPEQYDDETNTKFNAAYEGGLIGAAAPAPEGQIGDKLELNLSGLKIQPKRWNADKTELVWNTIKSSTGEEVNPTDLQTGTSTEDDLDRRFKGGNIYGGCYNSGHVNGNVIININASIVDRKGDDAIFDQIDEKEGEAILYGKDSYNITERKSGVILDEQGMDVLGKALNVFGGGYGAESEIWGSTTINLNKGYVFQVFGGGENGAIGRATYNSTTGKLEYTYDPRYSCHVNLRGNKEGVYRGHADDSDDMAETEFIYGGSFEAPIAGNTIINLGNGRIFNSFAGSCNADILGHTETYIGRQKKEDGTYEDGGGFPWIRDHVYGGNDLGGQILGDSIFFTRVNTPAQAKVYNPKGDDSPEVTKASAYMEYIQGRVGYIFGGCYGDYDYTDAHFSKYTYPDGKSKSGFTKPRLDNAFVNFRPNNHTRNELERIFGAGQGASKGFGVDSMQNRSYILVDIPQTITKFQDVAVFGAGANCGLGMGVDPAITFTDEAYKATAVIDLISGKVKNAYGGGFAEGTTRRTVINVPRGATIQLDSIFGGAYGKDPLYPCDVYEAQVNYQSEDATVNTIFGGNNSADRTLYGQVNISVPVWQDKTTGYMATVFGAGFGKDTWSQYTEINLLDGAKVYEVYGGGKNGKVLNLETLRKWKNDVPGLDLSLPGYSDEEGFDAGLNSPLAHAVSLDGKKYNTNVHIHQGATIVNYAYGGGLGADAVVSGTTYIDLLGGTVNKDIYAGGTSGAVEDYYKVGAKSDSNPYGFTATATAYIEGGTVRNVYGGGWEGDVGYHNKSTTDTTNDIPGETNVVIGIRKDQATLPDGYGFLKGVPAIQRNAYAGGEGGSIFGEAHVTVNNGYIGYFYDADSKEYAAKVDDETWSDHVGKDRLSDCGNVFGGGYDDNSSVDESFVTIWGGVIRNSVFGGGEIATIGRGKVTESGDDNKTREVSAIYKYGGTNITVYNGQIKRNVFGGGKGYNILGYGGIHGFYTDGYVFGQTKVYIHGGEIGTDAGLADGYGNVFGGGDVGFVYGKGYLSDKTKEKISTDSPGHIYYYDNAGHLTEDCKVLIAPMLQIRKNGTNVDFGGVTYKPFDYVPTDYLNTLPADKSNAAWTNLYTGSKKEDGSIDPNDPEERGIQIHNAVFAGGNVSSNSESYANATTVFGNTTATLYDVYHHDFITVGTEHTGGLYGGGNLSVVGGYRELNITNYGTDYYGLDQQITLEEYQKLTNRERAYFKLEYLCQQDVTINGKNYNAGDRISEDEYNALPAAYKTETYWVQYGFCSIYAGRLLNTIQRADFCGVYGSRLVLQGAKDRVADVADATEYTINRIGELSLNQKKSVVPGETALKPSPVDEDDYADMKNAVHGNYFGIYSVVNYLGSLTSDVKFTDHYRYVEKGNVKIDPTITYNDWKINRLEKRDRNNGTAINQVALASGVFLELTSEQSTPSKKVYGDITGIIELDLINVKKDIEGGGYVYARNEHGERTEVSHENTLLCEYNMKDGDEARTKKFYTYSETKLEAWQTSGNFIHKSKRIVDDCYPNNGIYQDHYQKSPAHYWFIKGEVYIYDQVVSAYAGSASAYSKEVKIPLTITAGSNGRLKLLNVQPNLYAYYADETRSESNKVGEDGVKVDNESMTYHLNDVITWWDWHQLADNEQKYFVKETVVNVDTCVINGVEYPSGTYVLENDLSVHASEVEPKTAYQHFMELHPNVYDKSGKLIEDLNALFHPSNNIAHGTGYALTLDMNSPKDWDGWYSPKNGDSYYTVDGGIVNTNRQRKDAYEALSAAQKELYREGPTYALAGESGLYGQREYGKGEIISKEVYTDYTTTVGKMAQQPEGQASAEPAYVAKVDFGTTQAGNAISQSEYNALADKSNFDPAMVCINTIQLGDEEYVLLGELVSGTSTNLTDLATKYMNYNNSKINADKIELAQALEYIHANLSDAYYITKDGLYGGQYYEAGENYSAIKSWCTLTDARDKFNYNYDALDLLVDPLYRGEAYIEDSYHSPYSDVKSVEYEAVYGGAGTLTYFDVSGAKHTIASGSSIPREDYEQVRNDQMHYTRVQVEAGTDDQTVYIVMDNIINNSTPYAKGQDISEKDYKSLSSINKEKVNIVNFKKGSTASVKYYCYEPYTPAKTFATEVGAPGAVGSVVADIIFNSDDVPNYQKYFNIQGSEPTETTTLYVSRESNAKDVTKEKVISVVYQYTYYESDDEGEGVSLVNELHVLNIHLQLESGAPEIGLLNAPPAVLPGNSVGLKAPTVNPGLYEILTSGWELFFSEEDAQLHRNGVPFVNNGTPLYWYQNQKVFLAFYSKTYLGKTYSNYVPLTVANYHDLDAIMKDKEHHLYVDHPDVMRNSKIYIDNRTCESDPTKSELDLLKDFFDLSMLSGPAPAGSALDGHANLNPHVAGGQNLEFILNSNVSPKAYTDWTPIGSAGGPCFSGNLHGDGYTISDLNNSLFGNLCGAVYNLGVTGSFTSAGIVDTGDGYVENSWINTSATSGFSAGIKAVFGNPSAKDGRKQIVNCYYPETKPYSTTDNGRGIARPMSESAFYNGTVAYDLNGFYLNKRYYDHEVPGGSAIEYNYLKQNADGTLEEEMSVGKYPSSYAFYPLDEHKSGQYGYVEDRYADGDFVYRGGTVPEAYDERMRVVHDGTSASMVYSPIWPDDYIYFGQMLTYDYNTTLPHEEQPSSIVKSGGRVVNNSQSNRVYRAPAYYRSNKQDVAHFNNVAYLVAYSKPESVTSTDVKEAYPNMTAIDFAGHNDTQYKQGLNGDFFYQPLLDIDDNLIDVVNEGETQNLLVYAPSAEEKPVTHTVLSTYFLNPAYANYYVDDDTRAVKEAPASSVHGHLVQSDLTATCDHLLVDKQDFNAPMAYTFDEGHRMWYQRKPDRYVDTSKGWESVSLPFTAELVTTHQKGEITHFYSGSKSIDPKSETKIGHEYWLRELTGLTTDASGEATGFFNYPDDTGKEAKVATNTFLWDYYYSNSAQKDANADIYQQFYSSSRAYAKYPYVQCATPYLIGFPGVTYYEFDLSGDFKAKGTASPAPIRLDQQVITFAAKTGETVAVTDNELEEGVVGPFSGYYFKPNYLNIEAPVNSYIMAADGSKYDKVTETTEDRKLSAFRTYFEAKKAVTRAIKFSNIDSQFGEEESQDNVADNVNIYAKNHKVVITSELRSTADVRIFNTGGLCVATFNIEPGQTIETPLYSEGVYMVHVDGARFRKKLMVK